jgi:hypothetical protein
VLVSERKHRWLAIVAAGTLAGCATPEARDIGGRWVPLQQFSTTPQPIPLRQAYLYQATPVDATLKTLLERWARDSGRTLSYQHGYDYTLHMQAARVSTHDIVAAAAEMTAAYAGEGIRIVVDDSRIVVSDARGAPVAATDQPATD